MAKKKERENDYWWAVELSSIDSIGGEWGERREYGESWKTVKSLKGDMWGDSLSQKKRGYYM